MKSTPQSLEFPQLQEASPTILQPIDLGTDIDLGELKLGATAEHDFVLHNSSAEDFTLTGVSKSCGCEATNVLEGTVVPSGGSLAITYMLSKYGTGLQSGRLTVFTNSKQKSLQAFEFRLKATYPRRIWSEPEQINFDWKQVGEGRACLLNVYATDPELLDKYFETITSRGLVTVTRIAKTDKSLIFRVVLADDAPAVQADDFVSLLFTDILGTRLDVRVRLRESHE